MDVYSSGISQINIEPLANSKRVLKMTIHERLGIGHVVHYIDHEEFALLMDAVMEAAAYVAQDAEEVA
jgi:hypothetical protein